MKIRIRPEINKFHWFNGTRFGYNHYHLDLWIVCITLTWQPFKREFLSSKLNFHVQGDGDGSAPELESIGISPTKHA